MPLLSLANLSNMPMMELLYVVFFQCRLLKALKLSGTSSQILCDSKSSLNNVLLGYDALIVTSRIGFRSNIDFLDTDG